MQFNNAYFAAIAELYRISPPRLRRRFWFVTLASFTVAVMELFLALTVSLLGVALATPEAVLQLKTVRRIFDVFPSIEPYMQNQRTLLSTLLLGIVLCLSAKMAFSLYTYWKQGQFAQKFSQHITQLLLKGYFFASYSWHTRQETALLQTHLNWCSLVTVFFMDILHSIASVFVALLLLSGVLIATPAIGLFVLSVTGVSGFIIYRWTRRRVDRISHRLAETQAEFNRVTLAALQGIREILIYQQQPQFLTTCDSILDDICRLRPRLTILPPFPPLALEIVGMVMLLAGVLYLSARGASMTYMTGTLTLMAAVAWRLLPTINRFIEHQIDARAQFPYVSQLLARLTELNGFIAENAQVSAEACPLNREIRLHDVSFRYPESRTSKPDALRHISLSIAKGQKIGFVGVSGAGKSTVVGLLTGLLTPTAGSISVDGKEMTPERRAGWMRGIGYVPQSTFLLNASIAQNVAFSHWGDPVDRERVLACCRMAAVTFLDDLPDGMDTVIGERGIRLSGGQVQRISIARALYDAPHTLILDEATSALDGATESSILRTLKHLDAGMTVIFIAHRLETLESCDYLYWLRNGTLYMRGETQTVLKEYINFLDKKQGTDM